MTNVATANHQAKYPGFFLRFENWMDGWGKASWITLMVLCFVLFWPIGLALLLFMIMKGKFKLRANHGIDRKTMMMVNGSTGNAAFDKYKSETLDRLEREQQSFEAFLQRLREAKDKAEFDQFMDDRARSDYEGDAREDK
ncbi:MAG: DUF2852 domain-containing protein [Roseovarius sp.]|nr:DUF2852 domain-containing protein [Roseovarius sp.]MCY4291139.1 DUF2852 domain-containing protein [Roseovarius sp.]